MTFSERYLHSFPRISGRDIWYVSVDKVSLEEGRVRADVSFQREVFRLPLLMKWGEKFFLSRRPNFRITETHINETISSQANFALRHKFENC